MKTTEIEVFRPACDVNSTMVAARAMVDQDLSGLMPYINAVLDKAQYFPKGPFIRFRLKGVYPVNVEPDRFAVGGFEDADQARDAVREVLEFLADLKSRMGEIEPSAKPYSPPPIMEIFKLLPKKSGCGKCGHPSCMAFAAALSKGDAEADSCPEICAGDKEEYSKLVELLVG